MVVQIKEFVTPAAAKAALAMVNMEVGLDYWLPCDKLGKLESLRNHTRDFDAVRPTCVVRSTLLITDTLSYS